MNSTDKEVASELLPFLRVYKDGTVKRLTESPIVPPSPEDPETGVSSKDITISENPHIGARIYLPKLTQPDQRLPVLVYFHGGGFCFESAYSLVETKLMNSLVSEAKLVGISVDYRLAPEHPLPIPHEDCWTALNWVASHSNDHDHHHVVENEPWLMNHGDFERVFVGGDSAGGNLAHYTLMRAGSERLHGGVKISGAFLTHPYFWGSKPVGSEISDVEERKKLAPFRVWQYLSPLASAGIDNVMINPVGEGKPGLGKLGCSRLLIGVSELDLLRARGILYVNAVKESGFVGEVELVEVEGEDHAFHILNYESENAKKMIRRLASFLLK